MKKQIHHAVVLWIGVFISSAGCHPFVRPGAAIIPGLGLLNNKKEEERKRQKRNQQAPQLVLPQRKIQRSSDVPISSKSHTFESGSGGREPRKLQQQQMFPRSEKYEPLPPPPRESEDMAYVEVGQEPHSATSQNLQNIGHDIEIDDANVQVQAVSSEAPSFDTVDREEAVFVGKEADAEHGNVDLRQQVHADGERGHDGTDDEFLSTREETPQPQMWNQAEGRFDPYAVIPPPPGTWGSPPVDGPWSPPYDVHKHQLFGGPDLQQERLHPPPLYPPPTAQNDNAQVHRLRHDLDDSLARERQLIQELQNVTSALSRLQTQGDIHLQQVDMLTERLADAEAKAASERNAALEYRANCTELGQSLRMLQDDLDVWMDRCQRLEEMQNETERKLRKSANELRSRSVELEELSIFVENLRLRDEHDVYLAERRKKKSGLLSWLFGGFLRGDDDRDEQLDAAQELARSTLLRALQNERNNVEELETVVSTLQQNNSAISEVVSSRDSLIDELNDRVGVFEEDKLVLKAALRQLQKEIKEEAPKTQKLIKELKDANEANERFRVEIDDLVASHRHEIAQLQQTISRKQAAINDKESNLTVIGTYVDKLEERLGDFALARKEIEVREEKCKLVEKNSMEVERERDELLKRVDVYASEESEFKALLEDLATERAESRREIDRLESERLHLLDQEQRLQKSIGGLEVEVEEMTGKHEVWHKRVTELESERESLLTSLEEVEKAKNEALARAEEESSRFALQSSSDDGIKEEIKKRENEVEELAADRDMLRNSLEEAKRAKNEALALVGVLEARLTRQTDEFPINPKSIATYEPVLNMKTMSRFQDIESGALVQDNREVLVPTATAPTLPEYHDLCDDESEPDEQMQSKPALTDDGLESVDTNVTTPVMRPSEGSRTPPILLNATLKNETTAASGQAAQRSSSRLPQVAKLPRKSRRILFRRIRKAFSKATGVHGFFTPSSRSQSFPNPPKSSYPRPVSDTAQPLMPKMKR